MSMKRALGWILGLGVAGLLFSGYLTYQEYFVPSAEPTCTPVGAPGTLLGYPPCLYGFAMYLAIVIFAGWGLFSARRTHGATDAPSFSRPLDPKPS